MIPPLVEAAVAAAFPHDDVRINLRAPEVHQSNQLFDVWAGERHFIAKQYLKEDEWETAPVREHASLQLLEPLEMAPRPFFYDGAIGPLVIYHYMEGRMWGRYKPSTDELKQLAATIARVHQLPAAGMWLARGSEMTLGERIAWFEQMIGNYAAWAEAYYAPGQQVVALCRPLLERGVAVFEHLYRTMPALTFCRSDPRFANVIVRADGHLGFVDWEDAGLRDPALEFADLFLHTEQEDLLTAAEYAPFLATYCECMGRDPEPLSARIADYARILPLFYIVILMRYGIGLHKAGKLAGWQVNAMPANLRLQRYLARGKAQELFDFDPGAYGEVSFFPTGK